MTKLLYLEDVSLAFGLDPILDHVKLHVSSGERVCLIGRNGEGKSTLLKVIADEEKPDSGTVWRKPELRLARLAQELPQKSTATVFEFVAEGLLEVGQLLAAYYAFTNKVTANPEPAELDYLAQLQKEIEAKNGWQYEQKIKTILSRLELNGAAKITELSGGWQRRAALARALVLDPELLLLDEPTNHLDIEAIQWLENELLNSSAALIFITHDRALLQRLATRIIELDRGMLTSWPGNYANFLQKKSESLATEAKFYAEFDKKLLQEEQWIRQGIKARRTRNEGRVRALEAMRKKRGERRNVGGKANISLNEASASGQLVIEAQNITQEYQSRTIIKNLSLRVMRGDRIGLIGPNGVGKSTLLNVLLKHVQPQQGEVVHGTKLEIAYFDQLRMVLDLTKSVADNIAQGSNFVEINGQKRHIITYLADFLFTAERARTPVEALSGGECNRLLLARLFSKPSNLLVMDEPTNDLDIETLELLEDLLIQYQGTLLLVSHDRKFLDNVVTSTLVFEGDGKIEEYIGGYQDWMRQVTHVAVKEQKSAKPIEKTTDVKNNKKLNYKEQRELEVLPKNIEKMETELAELQTMATSPAFYQQGSDAIAKKTARIKELIAAIEQAYLRWEELENHQ